MVKSGKNTKKKAHANIESLRRIFTVPVEDSTLDRIDQEISSNLLGFLNDNIVAGDIEPHVLEQDFQETKIPEDPIFVSEQSQFLLDKVVAQSVHTASPSFVGHMTSAVPYFMLPLAKIMIALNQNPVKIETSKAFTPLERQVIGMLHRLVYNRSDAYYAERTQSYETSLGNFCSGGTIANITGLWVARNRMFAPEGTFNGIGVEGVYRALRHKNLEGMAILVSKRAHYSLRKSADLLGLGRDQIIAIETDENNKVIVDEMKREIYKLKEARIGLLAIVGIAGTTETGNVDPLEKLAHLAKREGCHFHVDGAWGGPTLFSDRYRSLLKGIELADSVTIDAHKQLLVPMGAGLCLFKDATSLNYIETNANYIVRKGSRDIGKHTLEGGRSGMAMLVHSGLRIIGRKGYEVIIDLGIGKAGQFAKMIGANPAFELVTKPELNLLTYRYVPEELRKKLQSKDLTEVRAANSLLSQLNEQIQKRQRATGKTFVSRTTLEAHQYKGQPVTVLRAVLANPLTTRAILEGILEEQQSYGEAIFKETDWEAEFNREWELESQ
jgi:glutamate decarboxylase